MKEQGSRWRRWAREAIDQAVAEAEKQGLDRAATLKLIDDAYPFGQRKMWPYAKWLQERRITIEALQLPTCHPRPVYTCPYCEDQGCLVCGKPQPGGHLPAAYYTGGPRDGFTR